MTCPNGLLTIPTPYRNVWNPRFSNFWVAGRKEHRYSHWHLVANLGPTPKHFGVMPQPFIRPRKLTWTLQEERTHVSCRWRKMVASRTKIHSHRKTMGPVQTTTIRCLAVSRGNKKRWKVYEYNFFFSSQERDILFHGVGLVVFIDRCSATIFLDNDNRDFFNLKLKYLQLYAICRSQLFIKIESPFALLPSSQ